MLKNIYSFILEGPEKSFFKRPLNQYITFRKEIELILVSKVNILLLQKHIGYVLYIIWYLAGEAYHLGFEINSFSFRFMDSFPAALLGQNLSLQLDLKTIITMNYGNRIIV